MTRAVEDVLHEIGADEVPRVLVLAKADRSTTSGGLSSRTATPTRCWSPPQTGEGIRALVRADRGGVRAPLRTSSCWFRTTRAGGSPSCTSSPATSSARTRPKACACSPGCRGGRRALSRRSR